MSQRTKCVVTTVVLAPFGRMFYAFVWFFTASVALGLFTCPAAAQTRGRLANPGFENQPMKSTYFFAGDWRGPAPRQNFYEGVTPALNECRYSIYPLNSQHLGWSETLANRVFAVNTMLATGVNVVNMSYWGPALPFVVDPGNQPAGDNIWAWYAPMQTAIGAHNELFDVAVGRPLLIFPTIEEADANTYPPAPFLRQPSCPGDQPEFGPVGNSAGYHFADEFPGTQQNPAPGLVLRIEDLINRYLKGGNSDWATKWAQLYDKNGTPRYVINIIHAGSNQLRNGEHCPGALEPCDPTSLCAVTGFGHCVSPSTAESDFATGFDWVADKVWQDTGGPNGGVHVGFTFDAIPLPIGLGSPQVPARFYPIPEDTALYLAQHSSVLAIQAFVPEVFVGDCSLTLNPGSNCDQVAGSSALNNLIDFKRQYLQRWVASGVPVILDVAPGYDNHIVFGPGFDIRYGNNDPWRNAQSGFLSLGVVGLVGNTWNGFTEAYALMPACGTPPGLLCSPDNVFPEDVNYQWFRGLIPPGGSPAKLPSAITSVSPASGACSDAVTLTAKLTEALRDGPSGTTIGGSAIAGRTVHFKVGSQSVDGATDVNGTATATITLNQQPTTVERLVSFAGDNTYLSLFVKDGFVITREPTVLHYTGTQAIANAGTATLSALLTDDDGRPLGGKTVSFTLGSGATAQSCPGVTDPAGNAGCQLNISQVLGPQTVSVKFVGDSCYEPASTAASVVIFAYLTAGSFVIADRAAQAGASVLFWGDTWSQFNKPSAGPAPLSFKGFANDVGGYPPRCGVNWKTTTGNSPPPPPGPLPSYMAVSVASSVKQTGSMPAGNTQRIVVVQTKPGYAPDPSHPGTGTVVATVCGP